MGDAIDRRGNWKLRPPNTHMHTVRESRSQGEGGGGGEVTTAAAARRRNWAGPLTPSLNGSNSQFAEACGYLRIESPSRIRGSKRRLVCFVIVLTEAYRRGLSYVCLCVCVCVRACVCARACALC